MQTVMHLVKLASVMTSQVVIKLHFAGSYSCCAFSRYPNQSDSGVLGACDFHRRHVWQWQEMVVLQLDQTGIFKKFKYMHSADHLRLDSGVWVLVVRRCKVVEAALYGLGQITAYCLPTQGCWRVLLHRLQVQTLSVCERDHASSVYLAALHSSAVTTPPSPAQLEARIQGIPFLRESQGIR